MAVLAVVLVVAAVVAYLAFSKSTPVPSPEGGAEAVSTTVPDGADASAAAEVDALADFVLEQVLEDDALTAEVEGDADLILESENDLNAFSEASYDEGL